MKCKHDLENIFEGMINFSDAYYPIFKCKKCLKYFTLEIDNKNNKEKFKEIKKPFEENE